MTQAQSATADGVREAAARIKAYLDKRYRTGGVGAVAAAQFESQTRATPDVPGEDDDHPSCRIN